jgi:hypothetical protein
MPRATVVLLTLWYSLAGVAAAAAATQWAVKTDRPSAPCVLESSRESVWDGYQKTTAYFSITARSVSLISAAPFDGDAGDIGLAVDDETVIKMDRLGGDKVALFDSKFDRLIEQLKAGQEARVQMRFWPTWPVTGAHSVKFSLIGFTRAYTQLSACR